MDIPRCNHTKYCIYGYAKGRQSYQCKSCKYRYTVAKKSDVKDLETRKLARDMYLEGMGFRAIGRVLKISYVTAYYWIKSYGEQAKNREVSTSGVVIEMDEIHTYVQQKKTTVGSG